VCEKRNILSELGLGEGRLGDDEGEDEGERYKDGAHCAGLRVRLGILTREEKLRERI
jgi:hypothetical protein